MISGLLSWAEQTSSGKSTDDPKTLDIEENRINCNDLLNEGEEIMQLGDYKSIHSLKYKWQEPVIQTSTNNGK